MLKNLNVLIDVSKNSRENGEDAAFLTAAAPGRGRGRGVDGLGRPRAGADG